MRAVYLLTELSTNLSKNCIFKLNLRHISFLAIARGVNVHHIYLQNVPLTLISCCLFYKIQIAVYLRKMCYRRWNIVIQSKRVERYYSIQNRIIIKILTRVSVIDGKVTKLPFARSSKGFGNLRVVLPRTATVKIRLVFPKIGKNNLEG